MGFKDWWYKNFGQRKWPKTISITFRFYGKGSDDTLYYTSKDIPFDKPLERKYVASDYDDDYNWNIYSIIRKEYTIKILEECRKELLAARQEHIIELDSEERITGDYIVSVEGSVSVGEWRLLTREEWLMLKAIEGK